ncbi:MAG: MaoC family dehydratase [Rhizobium sp.]|nr:MaoC family dehydratase [Rhizobium sp.]MBX9455311.1 MaoC family dehydratase [Rhizobium sp.]
MADGGTARTVRPLTIDEFNAMSGTPVGTSPWRIVSQPDIGLFAGVTGDLQYIHVDPDRARDGPFGGTIAHGMLSLSLISVMFNEAVPPVEGVAMSLNYGFDKVRFLSPVPSDSEIRGSFTLSGIEQRGERQYLFRYTVTMQVRGAAKPAVHAEWLVMHVLA